MCTKPYPDIILQVLAVPDLLNFPKGYRMLSQGNFCFGYFSKFLFSLGPPPTIPFLLSWFVLHDGCCNLGKILFQPFSTFPTSLITFQVPISLKLKLSSSFRNSVLKNEEYSSRSWKRFPLRHVQLTVSSLFRLTRDNHVQTNRHRANYGSWLITTPFPSSALASSTTSSWLLPGSTLTLPLEWSLAYLPW